MLTRVRHRGRWVRSRAPLGSLILSGVVEFTRVRPKCRWVYLGSLGSLTRALGVVGFIRGRWIYWRAPLWSLVYPGSLGLLGCAFGIIRFIQCSWVNSRASKSSLGSSAVVGFTRARHGGRWVHSRAP